MQPRLFLARIVLTLMGMNLLHAQESSCTPNLPPFTYQDPRSPVLPVGVQVLFPAQAFACPGSVTMWGVAVNGSGSHDVHLQIWRPSGLEADNETRSFTLVGSNIFYIVPIPGISLFYLMPDKQRTLSVEKGDVLGLYIEDTGTEESFRVQYQRNVTDSVIYAYAADAALDFIEPDSMLPSSVFMNAAPVLSVIIDPETVSTENTTPTEGATPTITPDSTTPTDMTEGTTRTAEGTITMGSTTPTITNTTTTRLQEGTTSVTLSIDDVTQATPNLTATTPTHRTATTQRLATPIDTVATPTTKESNSTTSEEESTDTKTTTSRTAESDDEEERTREERTSVSPDETKPTLALPVVMITSAMVVGIVGVCLAVTVMLVRAVRRRMSRGHGHCLPHKPIPFPPPPTLPPPPPPPRQYELEAHVKGGEKNLQAKLTSSLSSSLTSSLIWWLHGEKEQLRMLMAREYETPIVTKCHVAILESSMHHYETPAIASAKVVNFLQSAHHYEDIS